MEEKPLQKQPATQPAIDKHLAKSRIARWHPRFSLRSMLLYMAVVAVLIGPKLNRIRNQRAIVAAIQQEGRGFVDYREVGDDGWIKGENPIQPGWLRRLLGDDVFYEVQSVTLNEVSDDLLARLKLLPNLRSLCINIFASKLSDEQCRLIGELAELRELTVGNNVGDSGVWHFRQSNNLHVLRLSNNSDMTNRGIKYLYAFTDLKYFSAAFNSDGVSQDALEHLQKIIPDCRIHVIGRVYYESR